MHILTLYPAADRPTPARVIRAALFVLCLTAHAAAGAGEISEGDAAPAFRLQDQNGDWHTLDDYTGEWVALYFYPKDDTPGCTTEACAFRDDIFKFKKLGVKLIGVSLDDVASHKEFAAKYHLPFTLLSDAKRELAESYGVLRNYGLMKIAARETFLISPQGQVAKHYRKVEAAAHSGQVLADLRALMAPPEAT